MALPRSALVALAVLAYAAALRRPGWPVAVFRPLGRPLGVCVAAAISAAFGLVADPYARLSLAGWLTSALLPALAPAGEWFHAPRLPADLLAALPLALVVAAEAWSPGASRPARLPQLSLRLTRQLWPATRSLLWLAPLLMGWLDVVATTFGAAGREVYERLGSAGLPLPGQLGGEPDLRLPALGWWIAACAVAPAAARTLPKGDRSLQTDRPRTADPSARSGQAFGLRTSDWRRLWLLVPLVAGGLGWLARDAALALAVPAFGAVSAIALLDALVVEREAAAKAGSVLRPLHQSHRGSRKASSLRLGTSDVGLGPATRIALAGVLALALSLRWTERMAGPPASDTLGYFEAARDFWRRVGQEGTNPIALAYLNVHPASREPLFIVLLSLWFKVAGATLVHQRYLTALASVGCVGLTYAFGRATLGPLAGLGAALLLAVEPWHVVVSQEGLREEGALLFVYGLALLAITRRRATVDRVQSAKCTVQSEGACRSQPGFGLGSALAAGALAGAAVLTRLDAGAVVVFLLAWWTWRLGANWRRAAPAWIVFAALVGPLLAGYQLRAGQALTPLGSSMGGDIQASIGALLRGRFTPPQVLAYFAAGTAAVYRDSIFAGMTEHLSPPAGSIALAILLAAYAAGCATLLVRGPRLPAVLSLLGAFAPPFVFIAGVGALGGPGGGYSERYTYLIIPAVLSVTAWSCWSALRLAVRGVVGGIESGHVWPATFRSAFRGAFRGAFRDADRRAHRL